MADGAPQAITTPTIPPVLQDDPLDPTLAALSTLSLLNLRLSRLEHLLTGKDGQNYTQENESSGRAATARDPSSKSRSKSKSRSTAKPIQYDIPQQLYILETRLAALRRLDGLPGSLIRMVETLRREYPEIFVSSSSSAIVSPSTLSATISSAPTPTTAQLSRQATQVLAHASLYTSTSSRLQTLQTLRIPAATVSTDMIEHGGGQRMRDLISRQEDLERRSENLKDRSTKVLQWWIDVGVKGMGEVWEDWEDRVAVCERFVKIHERKAREERGEEG